MMTASSGGSRTEESRVDAERPPCFYEDSTPVALCVTGMVDRVYKEDLPQSRSKLEGLREEFVKLGPSGARWARLRIDPLLKHVDTLEQLIHSDEFSGESSRLTKGVELFHSDLVYFRQNIRGLQRLLLSEKKRLTK